MRRIAVLSALCFLVVTSACSSRVKDPDSNAATSLPISNPSGDCIAPDAGDRPGYHAADPDSTWLLDCQNSLKREYFRVFARTAESAYIIPRADGAPYLAAACADPEHELFPILTQYLLCESASSSAAVERVNNMKPGDALTVTRYLHAQLRFEVAERGISPFPIPSDIVDACALHPEQNSEAFNVLCERERERMNAGNDIGFSYEGPGAVELASRLNELYGIASSTVTRVCTPGADQTCNDDPKISSLHGRCNADGTCTCLGFERNPDTGRCR